MCAARKQRHLMENLRNAIQETATSIYTEHLPILILAGIIVVLLFVVYCMCRRKRRTTTPILPTSTTGSQTSGDLLHSGISTGRAYRLPPLEEAGSMQRISNPIDVHARSSKLPSWVEKAYMESKSHS